MKKRILTAAYSALVPFALLADDGVTLNSIVNNFAARLFVLLGGFIPGIVLSIKFAVEMVKTYYAREQNPEAFKSAIIKFALAVFAIVNLSLITFLVFGRNFTA